METIAAATARAHGVRGGNDLHSALFQPLLGAPALDLSREVVHLVDQFQIPAEAAGLTLTQTSNESVFCEADRTQIERLITNLLSNAMKYTPEGGRVTACAENTAAGVSLVIEDSGVGIPQSHIPYIFDRFYRVPDPNPEKGLGLGLSFVASIVKAHGGEINVVSHVGKGTRFEVSLPKGSARLADDQLMADRTPLTRS